MLLKSPVRKIRTPGSVQGASSNRCPYCDPGRLHGNRSNGRLEKPLSQFMEIASKAGKDFDRFSISIRRDCNIDFGRTDIDTGSIGIDGFEGLWSDGFVAVFLLGLWFVIRFLLLEVKEIVLRTQTRLLL
jgi:hypothetical protein